ncbi:hypothetical protein RN001_002637 [Aquatica leii]|uniref:Uncharacterized protein n=1 Tax=Aquatica leii TaxID=1421715 RepID=A0AAN7SDF3_9COLE|nr:hypothetical protein RN001_002637 [Aquatica leii]
MLQNGDCVLSTLIPLNNQFYSIKRFWEPNLLMDRCFLHFPLRFLLQTTGLPLRLTTDHSDCVIILKK